MVQELDESFDVVFFIGYHAKAGSPRGLFAHTGDGNVRDLVINNRSVGEGGWNALVAAWYGVPVGLVTGDDVAVAQVKEDVPGIRGVVVKRALDSRSTVLEPLAKARLEIEKAAREAVAAVSGKTPPKRPGAIRVRLSFRDVVIPEVVEIIPMFERTAPDQIEFNADTMPKAYALIRFLYRWVGAPGPRAGYEY
jgi:D-amino peptidase